MNTTKPKADLLRKGIFLLGVALCFFPFIQPPIALLMGFVLSATIGHPFLKWNGKATKILLQVSVVGLGFGMNVYEAAKAGQEGLLFTVSSIVVTLVLGILLGKLLAVRQKTSVLISSGTAICGGSAIAAMAPVIDSNEEETSVSLATIFVLNSIALFVFPVVGRLLELSQHQFGLWAAIAIHDTSSVVGAAQKYGDTALQIATTVKLERALWIIPLTLVASFVFKRGKGRIVIPYFIFLFVAAMLLNTFVEPVQTISPYVVAVAKKGLTLTLFLIGSGLTLSALKKVGIKPLLLGVLLWIFISITSLLVILETIA